MQGKTEKVEGGTVTTYIDESAFSLRLVETDGQITLMPDATRFRLLSALGDGKLTWENGAMLLKKGDSVFVPADAPEIKMTGTLLLMAP